MTRRTVSASVHVGAPPAEVFALLVDPRRHHEFDGSRTLREAVDGPERLALGSTFGMRMRWGLPYRIRNTVVEFEEGTRIAWRHVGRHVWRYELAAVPGGTLVTETFDYRAAISPALLELFDAPRHNRRSIEATLARISARFGPLQPH